ncbi:MAG TPA: hypothetical protein VFP84_13010 [Kofleriaceae bacterium]|nr:hypothetical protein [Kofleriaceae bacterium]
MAEPLRLVGYWSGPNAEHLGFPDPQRLVDDDWQAEHRERIAAYLDAGTQAVSYMGFSYCRFGDCEHPDHCMLGTRELGDGTWLWPEGLSHYVRDHHVRIPDELAKVAIERGGDGPVTPLAPSPDGGFAVNMQYWLRWAAEHTAAPPAAPDACSLDDAVAMCAELATPAWSAQIALERGRWRIVHTLGDRTFEDFTAALPAGALRAHLFKHRRPDPDGVISPKRAAELSAERSIHGAGCEPIAGRRESNGRLWWAVMSSGPNPRKPLEEVDLKKVEMPEPGWMVALPDGWSIEVMPAMDEPAWRFHVEKWRAEVEARAARDAEKVEKGDQAAKAAQQEKAAKRAQAARAHAGASTDAPASPSASTTAVSPASTPTLSSASSSAAGPVAPPPSFWKRVLGVFGRRTA